MAFCAGQTFLFPRNHETLTEHLWIIATEPNAEGWFATTSFTTLRGAKDQTIIFRKAEHSFLKWDTCVLYGQSEILNTQKLDALLASGSAKMHQDVAPEMLSLILDGFVASDHTKNRVRDFVRDYRRSAHRGKTPNPGN